MLDTGNPAHEETVEMDDQSTSTLPRQIRRARNQKPQPTAERTETPREKFLRIGQYRMRNLLHDLRLVGNLSGQSYQWSPKDIETMQAMTLRAVEDTFDRFSKRRIEKLEDAFDLAKLVSAE